MHELAIVESRADRASVHICDRLRELADWEVHEDESRSAADGGGTYYRLETESTGVELRSFEAFHLELESPVDAFDCEPDLLVFASRHSGETGPLLTGHFTGNFGPAEFGGEDNAVAAACPNALARLRSAFDEYAPAGYDVGMECTHHGPTDVGCPSLFAELGSDEAQWDDPDGAEAVARAILELRGVSPHREEQVVGFGGNHYAPRFERIVRETPWAVGHIAADWGLEAMGHPDAHRDVLAAAFEASEADLAVVDGEWPVLEETIADLGYRTVGETWLREVGDRPLELVDAVESELGTVEDGTRFGEIRESSCTVLELSGELIDTAEGIDPDRVREIVAGHTVAFATENGGSRVGTQVAVPDADTDDAADAREEIVAELAAVLEAKYDTVRLEDDAVVAERTAFDPELAREVGVPEGPKFGALADGESVTVDGETVSPERVCRRQTDRFQK
ncbi:D-aminoacyl-tRNA deacylase [Natronolimnohabitans sp. A-GB9]|uniref:D-aminoacyl-tRNA deacylase n=1 Tax=Natronolimnohabitans sp. A-GB9 TaxID=3069757 RepID=UPI0027B5FC42|nr:D-aminoacyl-tRNA deacylase [Natronolimnohabitans sp. A-GB9]MDQ2049246.1 D-aminoacyl-tRNA deacylase [Natronolimnohabitans sp. A-GB9]